MQITRTCRFTGKVSTRELPVTQEQLDEWVAGGLIQKVMPHLTPGQREFLMTGSSEEWWEENIGSDPEEEEEEEEGSMPNGISILNTTVCRNLNLPPIEEK
tara:strand:- start:869 stop:1171 length:303 start_codon:yes stop_codon:yes gene_type:complete